MRRAQGGRPTRVMSGYWFDGLLLGRTGGRGKPFDAAQSHRIGTTRVALECYDREVLTY